MKDKDQKTSDKIVAGKMNMEALCIVEFYPLLPEPNTIRHPGLIGNPAYNPGVAEELSKSLENYSVKLANLKRGD